VDSVLSTMTMEMPAMTALMKKNRKICRSTRAVELARGDDEEGPQRRLCMVENITESTVRPSSAF